ncbi:MAG: cysteine peptidase family C39 domain-containing protein [Pseudomonadota bacterium]
MGRVKTPTVLQMEAVECGAASLGIILAYHGRWVPLEELRTACGVNRDGSNARIMLMAARQYGLAAKPLRISVAKLMRTQAPFIVFWNFNHFLVVEGFSRNTVHLNDPAMGRRRVELSEFERRYTGLAFTLTPGPEFKRSGRPPSVSRAIRERLGAAPVAIAMIAAMAVAAAIPTVVAAGLSRVFVDQVLVGGQHAWLLWLVVAAAFTAVGHIVAVLTLQDLLRGLETKLALTGAAKLLWHLLRLPYVYFTQREAGDVVNRLRSNDLAARMVVKDVGFTLARLLGALVFIAAIALTNLWIAFVAVAFAGLSVAMTVATQRRVRDGSLSIQMHQARVFASTAHYLKSAETLKATGTQGSAFARWAGQHAVTVDLEQTLARHVARLRALPPLTNGAALAIILLIGCAAIMDGRMTEGSLVAIVALLAAVREPIQALAGMIADSGSVRAAFARIDDVHRYALAPEFTQPPAQPTAITGKARLSGRIEFENVTFGYSQHAEPLIKEFSLVIPPGARVALVGATGSGKSTIAKLVAGLYRPWSGSILLDGVPVDEIPRWLLKTSVGWVDQDVSLLGVSVRENLTYWDSSISEPTLTQALKDAAIYEEIAKRPGGFDHRVLPGGANFSGGEAQRLQIARAFSLDPSIVLFDEAMSALDPLLEQDIDRQLRARGCTALIVAHRLSTIRDCDEIVYMENGHAVERGTHATLMNSRRRYRDLVSS